MASRRISSKFQAIDGERKMSMPKGAITKKSPSLLLCGVGGDQGQSRGIENNDLPIEEWIYLAMDGHFGHHQAVLMAQSNSLHLISKLRKDAAIYEKYEGEYSGRGAKGVPQYGEKLNYENLPPKYLKKSERENEVVTNYYQGIFLSKRFGCRLNVLIIEKINLPTQKVAHAVLFSSDEELSSEKLLEYYSLRFQIEFNFRDAKKHFGLEDFMTTTETGVENAANLAFLMVNVCANLLKTEGENCVGINDLKSQY